MNRFGALAAVLLLVVFMAAGCSGNKGEEETIKALIIKSFKMLQEENLEGYLSTLHPEGVGYPELKSSLPNAFVMYDLEHKLVDIKVLKVSGKQAEVRTIQELRRLSGPENFRDYRSTTKHTLKKYQGEWRLYQMMEESMEYIER